MAKAKPQRWSVYLLRKRRDWVAFVEAADEAEALKKARALPEIVAKDRFRISVARE